MTNDPDGTAEESLDGVTGLGAARRALLQAAGIHTRADLTRLSPEQLMRAARMPRHQAERTLAALTNPPTTPLSPEAPAEEAPAGAHAAPTMEQPTSHKDPLSALRNRFQAMADGPATQSAPRLVKPLTRIAALLENADGHTKPLPKKQRMRLAERLTAFAARLEKGVNATQGRGLTPKREKKLRERLREERRALANALGVKPRRRPRKSDSQ